MLQTIKASLPNSIVFIDDGDRSEVSLARRPDPIMSTSSCISVRTLMEYDGRTTLSLGHLSEIDVDAAPSFDGIIDTPGGRIIVSASDLNVFFSDHSGSRRARIVIWTNHPTEPDDIVIGFERA